MNMNGYKCKEIECGITQSKGDLYSGARNQTSRMSVNGRVQIFLLNIPNGPCYWFEALQIPNPLGSWCSVWRMYGRIWDQETYPVSMRSRGSTTIPDSPWWQFTPAMMRYDLKAWSSLAATMPDCNYYVLLYSIFVLRIILAGIWLSVPRIRLAVHTREEEEQQQQQQWIRFCIFLDYKWSNLW